MRQQYGTLTSVVGICINVFLAVSKLLIGFFGHSIAILGDGINNFFDSISSVISLVSFRVASKPADKEHPYGHARFEYISSSIVAMLIAYVGISLSIESIQKIIQPTQTRLSPLHIAILVISILLKLWLFFFYRWVGRKIDSDLVIANAMDSMADIWATSVVLIALVVSPLIGIEIDGFMGLVVGMIILKSAYDILKETFNKIMGQAPSRESVHHIENLIQGYEGVLGVHDMIIHDYGPGRNFISVHVEVDARNNIITSHELVDKIERELEEQEDIHLTIHMDPVQTDDPKVQSIRAQVKEVVEDINPQYTVHDFRVVKSHEVLQVIFEVKVPQSVKDDDYTIEKHIKGVLHEKFREYLFVAQVTRSMD